MKLGATLKTCLIDAIPTPLAPGVEVDQPRAGSVIETKRLIYFWASPATLQRRLNHLGRESATAHQFRWKLNVL
jgi:hypothetical protein